MNKSAHIIRTDGSETEAVVQSWSQLEALIGAKCTDLFNLRDGRMCVVNDTGHHDGLPVNAKATQLYHGICRPGTAHQIVGDVAIIIDREWV